MLEMAPKRSTHQHENNTLSTCPEADRLVCALLEQETTARGHDAVRRGFHCTYVKKSLGNAVWIGFKCKGSEELFEENEKHQYQEHTTHDLTRPRPRRGELISSSID